MITIIAVGKLSKDYQKIFNSYSKKTTFFTKVQVFEVKESNEKNIALQKKRETKKIVEFIPKNNLVFLCAINGKNYSSEHFSSLFSSNTKITFIIGGSNGIDENFFSKLPIKKISFSSMTFAHQLFRIILIEQIFRGFSIINNMKYHK